MEKFSNNCKLSKNSVICADYRKKTKPTKEDWFNNFCNKTINKKNLYDGKKFIGTSCDDKCFCCSVKNGNKIGMDATKRCCKELYDAGVTPIPESCCALNDYKCTQVNNTTEQDYINSNMDLNSVSDLNSVPP
jgi:hypothetical protein